jgi:hypothetical protein
VKRRWYEHCGAPAVVRGPAGYAYVEEETIDIRYSTRMKGAKCERLEESGGHSGGGVSTAGANEGCCSWEVVTILSMGFCFHRVSYWVWSEAWLEMLVEFWITWCCSRLRGTLHRMWIEG